MAQMWFLYSSESAVVSGPFTTPQLQRKMETGEAVAENFVWWKGQREWIPVSTWAEQLPKLLELASGQTLQKPIWYIDIGKSPIGPLTQAELLENLKANEDLSRVRLWAVGMKKWLGIFELHDIMEMLGITRRENERAPLMGTVAVTRANEDPKGFVVKAASISIAGLGLAGAHELRRGDDIAVLIKSPDLGGNIHARGEVVYVTKAGYAGVRFNGINSENQSVIHDYVKRFQVALGSDDIKAA